MKVVVRVRPSADGDYSAWDIEDGTSIRLRADAAVKHKRPFYGLTGASNIVRGSNASLLELGGDGVSRISTPNSLAGAVQLVQLGRPGAVSPADTNNACKLCSQLPLCHPSSLADPTAGVSRVNFDTQPQLGAGLSIDWWPMPLCWSSVADPYSTPACRGSKGHGGAGLPF